MGCVLIVRVNICSNANVLSLSFTLNKFASLGLGCLDRGSNIGGLII
jgi:hypothetical protein